MTHRVRVIGGGRAGGSIAVALQRAGWDVAEPPLGRDAHLALAARGVDVLIVATPDAAIASVAVAVEPDDDCAVVHLSGSLGLAPLATHPRRAVVHPLISLPDAIRGADRLRGAWFGTSAAGDHMGEQIVAALDGRALRIDEDAWARYHAAAVIASNHLVALLGQAERVAATIGVPLAALVPLARGALDDVADLGPAAALTGPVRRGDHATVRRHIEALPEDERDAYRAMSTSARRLLEPAGAPPVSGGAG